jgi:uncharacterized caspase-like protein
MEGVVLKVNGREIALGARGNAIDRGATSAALDVDLSAATLTPEGDNVIEASAETADGLHLRSRGVSVAWHAAEGSKSEKPKLFAILSGISEYDNPELNLQFAARDAANMGRAIEIAARGLPFPGGVRILQLTSGGSAEPTKANLRAAFETVAREAAPSDVLVVYLAGHAIAVRDADDRYHYLTRDARSTDIARDATLLSAHSLSSAELKEWLSRKNMPLKQVLILDTCAAGAAFEDGAKLTETRDLSPDQIRAIELLKDSTGSWILMGSAADAVSYEATRYGQGLLTYALLDGMRGPALVEDGRVDVGRLFEFAQNETEQLARGIGGIQKPLVRIPGGQTFPIGLLQPQDRARIPLAAARPVVLQARAGADGGLRDPLRLAPALRAELRRVGRGSARGLEIAYWDEVSDDVPGAVTLLVPYSREGDKIRLKVQLDKDGLPLGERELLLDGGDPATIAGRVVQTMVEMLPQQPEESKH